ncbi:hypothetical protein EDD21DRAFT_419263 [Dissophora ornata]|nr:hypothetical protein BGZ58_002006 [Dissophora ornata]KAI8596870.1 hypothetical protein EDD21DRAFT_419263 [Dissophora ornata]
MSMIDQSLDDIIKTQRGDKKKMHGKKVSPLAAKSTAIPKKVSGGIQTRGAAIRTQKGAKAGKTASPYARPSAAKKETALFTESYKAAKAPVQEIFTAGYIPKPATTLKLFTTNYRAGQERGKQQQMAAAAKAAATVTGPLTTKSLRLVTTQAPKRETAVAPTPKLTLTTHNDRIPTGPRNMGPVAQNGGSRGGDYYRPSPAPATNNSRSNDRLDSRSGPSNHNNGGNRNGPSNHNSGNKNGASSHSSGSRGGVSSYSSGNRNGDRRGSDAPIDSRSGVNSRGNHDTRSQAQAAHGSSSNSNSNSRVPEASSSMNMDMDMDMDAEDGVVSIKGSAPSTSVTFRGESGPVTIEIENLDPGTTAEDVKYVCSRFGEIKSCICTNGFSQVTYARKAAGLAAIENLHGKKADNGKVLRVSMRKNVILHSDMPSSPVHAPTGIHGPMKILEKAVKGTITNAGTLYSDQLLAAQQMLKVQQHRMAQLQREEQRITSLRLQSDPQLSNMNSLSTSGVNRGFF